MKLSKPSPQHLKLARNLAKHRKKHGFTQTLVAAKMGTTATVISRLEAGRDFQMSTLERYANAIGVKLTIQVISKKPGITTKN